MSNTTPKTTTTKKDFYNTLLTLLSDAKAAGVVGYDYDEMTDMTNKEIASIDKKTEQAKARAEKAKAEGDDLREAIYAVLTPDLQTVAEIVSAVQASTGKTDLSAQKVTPRLKQLTDLGQAVKGEVSIQGPDGGKSRKLSAYALS